MALKATSFKIDDEILNKMRYVCGEAGISQADFIKAAINNECEKIRRERNGGAVVTLPNPQNFIFSDEEAREAVGVLSDAANKLSKINPALDFGLHNISDYATARLFKDSKKQREIFAANLYKDLENMKKGE